LTVNTMCNWARISALRLALVARSAQMEKVAITGVAGGAPTPVWDGSVAGNPTGSVATPIDLTGGANWQSYRYKTFQSVVPLRNISWLGAISGC
jgi:type IV pilus assembly protein PilW